MKCEACKGRGWPEPDVENGPCEEDCVPCSMCEGKGHPQFSGWWFVNVHHIDQSYGGGEEGGWWYTTGEILRTVPCRTRARAEALAERYNRLAERDYDRMRVPQISSVLSQGRRSASVDNCPGADFPDHRPHYE